jgi:hypothetical protein
LGRHRPRRGDNIKMDLPAARWENMDWIYPAQDKDEWLALVNGLVKLRFP